MAAKGGSTSESDRPTVVGMLREASSGRAPQIQEMPSASIRDRVAMRDGIELETWIWLPKDRVGPVPAILVRTPYQDHVMGWRRSGALRYCDAGFALVYQLIRGIGPSGGEFSFSNPLERWDGYDTVEWIASQDWCTGAVGMDGPSYAGMMQLSAAAAQPPHLRCIAPTVVSCDFFRHLPRVGGAFSRQHSLGWTEIISVESLAEITPGLWGDAALLQAPNSWKRLLHRPADEAAADVLQGDRLAHYNDVLVHSTFDEWWKARTLAPCDFARITVPTLIITGSYDGTTGSQYLWKQMEQHSSPQVERHLIIGPWDHGQAYVGGSDSHGPWHFGSAAEFDIFETRLSFFRKHLDGEGRGPELGGRVVAFASGSNEWFSSNTYPFSNTTLTQFYLNSDGFANITGHGDLSLRPPSSFRSSDSFRSDPSLPFMAVAANLDPAKILDLRELARQEDVLVYSTDVLSEPLLIAGEPEVVLHLSSDTPDCDVVCWLAEVTPDGRTSQLARGILRLRYRLGFDQETLLEPGKPECVTVSMSYIAHKLSPGSRLSLLIGSSLFPIIDPNPNTGEPISKATTLRTAFETVFHDADRQSHVILPLITVTAAQDSK